ncbi:MAG TPA: hypothetical protein VFI29_17040 [Hanamia sp.]|nr:hypothetical protein [Hanamia sp.]
MKKIFFAVGITFMVIGCNQTEKTDNTASSKNAEMQALYEQNLSTLKTFIADFEKEDLDGQAALIADSARWSSPAYGDTVHTKKHWLEAQKYYMDNWSNLHLSNAQFLPGIDSATHEFDGSVRYYGFWGGVHSSGFTGQVKFYGTYDFNKDHKIISGNDFFDVGGMMNAINSKGK